MARGNMKVNMAAFNERKEIKRHKINEGDNLFRFLPPYGEEADGYPYRRWSIAWLTDPETGRNRPYASPWSFGEKECPVGQYAKLLQDKRESLEKKLAAQDATKEEIKEKLKPISDVLWQIKPKSTFFYNAINKSGEVGILELKKSAHDTLKKAMKEYIADYNQDPTSLNSDPEDSGVWFKIKKTGQGMSTEYSVEKSQVKVKDPSTGKLSFQDDQSELPASVVENYEDLGSDLLKLYRQISYSDLRAVLMSNLASRHEALAKEFGVRAADLIKVEGFDFDSDVSEAAPVKSETEEKPKKAQSVVKKPMPKFDDEDSEEDFDPAPPKKTASKPKSQADEDFFNMADDLLND